MLMSRSGHRRAKLGAYNFARSRGAGMRPSLVAWTPNNGEFQRFDLYDIKGRLLKYEDDRVEWQMIVEAIAPDPQGGEIVELACLIVDDVEIKCVEGRFFGFPELDSVNWTAATMSVA